MKRVIAGRIGGGGGGASDVRTAADTLVDRLLVAGGDGGAGTGGSTPEDGGGSASAAPDVSVGSALLGFLTCTGGAAGTLLGPGAAGGGDCSGGDPGDAAGLAGAGNNGIARLGAGGGGYFDAGAGALLVGSGGGGGFDYPNPASPPAGVSAVTVTDGVRLANGLITVTFTVPPSLQGEDGVLHHAIEGAAINNATLGTFTDSKTSAVASDVTATVCWNDGGTPPPNNDCGAATISGGNRSFTVSVSHTFPEEGSYTAVTSVTGAEGSLTLNMPVSVTDAALSETGVRTRVSSGKTFTKVVANFTDADPAGTTSDYSATINWGEGMAATGGLIAPNGTAGWSVTGSHKYAQAGRWLLRHRLDPRHRQRKYFDHVGDQS